MFLLGARVNSIKLSELLRELLQLFMSRSVLFQLQGRMEEEGQKEALTPPPPKYSK